MAEGHDQHTSRGLLSVTSASRASRQQQPYSCRKHLGVLGAQAGEYTEGLRFLQWSSEYLLKTLIGSATKPSTIKVIWQVRAVSSC